MDQSFKREAEALLVDAIERLNIEMNAHSLDTWHTMGLTIPQSKALVLLRKQGPTRMGDISSALGSTVSATTNIMDRLVEKRLVDRVADPDDRRAVVCKLAASGNRVLNCQFDLIQNALPPLTDSFDVEQVQAFVDVVEAIRGELIRTPFVPSRPTRGR